MAAPARLHIQSSFPAVKEAAYETVKEAREKWMETGKEVGERKAASQAASRGWVLQIAIDPEPIGHQSARISAVTHSKKWGDDPFFLRYFEYGSVNIQAMPFLRPAHRAANKEFLKVMGDQLEGKIRRKTKRFKK